MFELIARWRPLQIPMMEAIDRARARVRERVWKLAGNHAGYPGIMEHFAGWTEYWSTIRFHCAFPCDKLCREKSLIGRPGIAAAADRVVIRSRIALVGGVRVAG